MAKRKAKRNVLTKATASKLPDGLINEGPVAYPLAGTSIIALQIYHNPERRPSIDGPWNNEADKVAWVDAETGLGCIMLRQEDGTISGYCGIGPDHPLFGFKADAVPIGISTIVHGRVTYGKACEVNRFANVPSGEPRKERYAVCHTTRTRLVQDYRTVQTTQDEFHDDLWWLGFDTSHPGDLIPKKPRDRRKGDVYRDQEFVYENCIALARKLKSMAEPQSDDAEADVSQRRLPPPTSATRA
jgi:hypothetical protein